MFLLKRRKVINCSWLCCFLVPERAGQPGLHYFRGRGFARMTKLTFHKWIFVMAEESSIVAAA